MSATATASPVKTLRIAEIITHGLRRGLEYAEKLVKDIPANKFAHMPHPNMNHPAFCIGHLSLYPNRVFTMLGRKDLVIEKAGYPELFQAGVQCVEQDGRYPEKDEIVGYYLERHRKIADFLPNVADDVLQRENPMEGRMKEIFPVIALGVNFLLTSHNMMHLGQISAWRRAIGMGPAM